MNKKVLVIEDNDDMRDNICEIIELAGYQVTSAEGGKKGVEKARTENPDVILCDVMMPDMDGYEVLFLLSKNAKTASIPFIFLTAKSEKNDFRKGMNLGADDYLTKPFEEMDLLRAIEMRLSKSEKIQKDYTSDFDGVMEFFTNAKAFENLSKISNDIREKHYSKKESIYQEGDVPSGVFFIKKGKVKTYRLNNEGKEYITSLFSAGEFFGFSAILEHSEYSESASCMEDCELLRISKDDFLKLIYSNREVAASFIRLLANNIKEKEEHLLLMAYDSVRKRVAHGLVDLYDKYKEDKKTEEVAINVSREDLANLVGTSTETVIRTLSDFKSESLVEVSGRTITIKDREKLAKLRF